MPSVSLPLAVAGIGSLAGGVASAIGSSNAAKTQQKSAQQANQVNWDMFNQIQQNLAPYLNLGKSATNQLSGALPTVAQPFNMTQDQLEQTPGYQFTLGQGLKSVQNSAAARGLGSSGAALKGAANYATGLADNTYQNQFNNYWTNALNKYNMQLGNYNALSNQVGIGENAAAGLGNTGSQVAQTVGSNIVGAGNAAAAGQVGVANALGGAANNAGNLYYTNNLLQGLFSGGGI